MALEDSLVQAKRIEHFFKKHNFNFIISSSAEEAFKEIEKEKPILIISDIIMPGIDGYQFCKIIKENSNTKHIPVILLTSLQDSNDIIRGLQAGADNFITKPYDQKHLLSRINHLLSNLDNVSTETEELCNSPIEIKYRGEEFSITSSKKQILDLLISVYDTAIQRNEELTEIKETLEKTNIELTHANEDLDAFARTVSHDLKSPLSVMIGFSSAILDNPQTTVSEEEIGYIKYMQDSAYQMNQLIKDLLSYSQSGRVQIEQTKLNLSDIANDIIGSILLRYPCNNPSISIEPGLIAYADPVMIRVALDNLLGNALKYSSKTENPKIIFGQKEYYGKQLFYIKDNGVGFESSKADKLFQPFVRLDSSAHYSGTGIGLSTVKRIIDKHGGDIWAESEPNKGATFFFTLQ